MALLNKKQIMESKDIVTETVAVPEWGGDVLIRTLTGTQRDAFEASLMGKGKKADMVNIRARLVARSVVDEQGARVFCDGEIEALGMKSAKALDRIFDAAQKLNGIREEDIEELEKNSEAAQDDSSI